MSDKTIKLDLSQIGDGGLQEKVDKELERVIANILDPNTETKTARKLAITLTMKPDDTRQTVATAMEVKSTLAPQKAIATTVLIGQEGSQVYANEVELAERALFEADGGKWKLEAIKNIADYLKAGLEDQDNITILA